MLRTKAFWIDAIERAVKTFAQGTVAVLSAGATDILDADLAGAAAAGALAAVISLLTSIGSAPFGERGTAALVSNR